MALQESESRPGAGQGALGIRRLLNHKENSNHQITNHKQFPIFNEISKFTAKTVLVIVNWILFVPRIPKIHLESSGSEG